MRVPVIQIYLTPNRSTAPVAPDAPPRHAQPDHGMCIEVRTPAARCLFPVHPAPPAPRRALFPVIHGEEDEESEEMEWSMPTAELACRRFFATLPPADLVADRVFTLLGAFVDFMTACGGQGRRAYHVEERTTTTVSGCLFLESDRPGEVVVRDLGLLPLQLDNLHVLVRTVNTVMRSSKPCFQSITNIFLEIPQQSKFILPSGGEDCTDLDIQHTLRTMCRHGFQGVPRGAFEGVDLTDFPWIRYSELAGFQKRRPTSE